VCLFSYFGKNVFTNPKKNAIIQIALQAYENVNINTKRNDLGIIFSTGGPIITAPRLALCLQMMRR
jgi:hypothetical protein